MSDSPAACAEDALGELPGAGVACVPGLAEPLVDGLVFRSSELTELEFPAFLALADEVLDGVADDVAGGHSVCGQATMSLRTTVPRPTSFMMTTATASNSAVGTITAQR